MAGELEQQRNANVVLTADVDPYRQSVQAAAVDTGKLTEKVDKLARSLDSLTKSAGRKLTLFGAGSAAGITAATVAFAGFDKQMTSLKVNAEVTGRNYDKMTRSVNGLRREFGVATSTAAELNRTVLSFKDNSTPVKKLTETFVKLGAAVGEAPDMLAQGMLQLQRSMGTSQRDTARYSNTLTDLSVKSGVAASSILEFSQMIAPVGRIAGMQQAEIMGVATAFNKAGQDGYYAANAFQSMLADITKSVQNGSPDLAKYANLIGVTVEQFKGMNKTQAITEVFDELNRLGPNAIQVLNQMGYEGMRMQRAIAGASQQSGGIGTAVAQAVAAYNDPNSTSLNKGSEVALDGVADRMHRLSESTKQMGEAMGSVFQGPAKAFLSTLEKIVSTVAELAGSTGGKMVAWVGALTAGLALAGGPLLKFATLLGTLALGRQTMNNWVTQGYQDRRNQKLGNGAFLTPTGSRMANNPESTNFAQRAMYNFGYNRLGALPPMTISRTMGVVPWAGAHFMNMWRGTLGGLTHPFDPGARPRLLATDFERANGQTFARYFSNSMIAGSAGAGPVTRSAIFGGRLGMLPVNWASRAMGFAGDRALQSPGFGAPFGQQMGFAARAGMATMGSLAGAGVGLGAVGLRAGLGVTRFGIGALGTGLAGMMTNPVGAAMLGIPLAMMAKSGMDKYNKTAVGSEYENVSLIESYKSAVGEATSATIGFADALKQAAVEANPETKKQAMIVSEQDKVLAAQMDKPYNKKLESATEAQAAQLLAGQLADPNVNPKLIQKTKLDLLKVFGADKTEDILASANRKRAFGFDTKGYFNESASMDAFSGDQWFGLRANKKLSDQQALLEGQFKDLKIAALAKGGSAAGNEVQKVLTNQYLGSFFGKYDSLSSGEKDAGFRFINKSLFGGKIDIGDEGNQMFANGLNKMVDWQQYAIDAHDVNKAYKKNGQTGAVQEFLRQMSTTDNGDTKQAYETYIGNMGLTREMAAAQIKSGKGSLFNSNFNTARLLMGSNVTPAEMTQMRLFSNDAGRVFQGDKKTMKAIDLAVTTPGNQNNQIQAMDAMVASLKRAGMSFGEIESALINFQGAVQDTSSPLYQLAAAARGVNAQNLQYDLPYMNRAGQFSVLATKHQGIMEATAPRIGRTLTPEAQELRKQSTAEFEGQKLAIRNTYMAMITQQREFNIAQARASSDFYEVQLPRMDQQYNLSRERAEEDFNISRTRSAQQFAISQKDAYFDFHLSRKRAEEDFAHQQVLLARQAAQGMYNSYERVAVQRTWSGQSLLTNSQDQLERMRQQNQDLAKVRQMGLSKTAIQQLGFTDAANAQQLARFIEDAMKDPSIVAKFNQNAKGRMAAGKKLATDPANPQWEEMRRQFRLTMSRGAEDFERAMGRNRRNYSISMKQAQIDFKRTMDRAAQDYNTALGNMKDDFKRQQDRAAADLKRSQKELTWSFEETLEKAVKRLGGQAGKQAQIILDVYNSVRDYLKNNQLEVYLNWKQMPGRTKTTDPTDRSGKYSKTSAAGGVYSGSQLLTVGEAGPELLLPLNSGAATFVSTLLHRFATDAHKMQVSHNALPTAGSQTYNYRVDSSTNFTGDVKVYGVENPREMAEKARLEARRKKLTMGVKK